METTGKPWAFAVALGAFPLLLLAINNSWAFPPTGYVDPWIYAGYHMHFAMMWRDFPTAYYGSRVPWTVLGWAVHRVAEPGASLIILALLLFYASTFSLFYAIYTIFKNAAAGFIAACLLGSNAWFLIAIGWNYVDGPSIACILLSLAALVEVARGNRWRTGAVLWGAFTAATITLYLSNVVLFPVELLIYVALDRLAYRRNAVMIALLWGAGFAGAVLAMALVNVAVGGASNFMNPTFAVLRGLTPAALNYIYYVPWQLWIVNAPWLYFAAFAALGGAAFLAVRGGPVLSAVFGRDDPNPELRNEASLLILSAAAIVALCGFGFMQALRWSMLQLFFEANRLLAFAFLTIGGFIAVGTSRGSRRFDWYFGSAAALLCLAPWLLPKLDSSLSFGGVATEILWTCAGSALLIGVAFVRNRLLVPAAVLFISLLGVATILPTTTIQLPQDTTYRDGTLAVFDAAIIIDGSERTHPNIWWDLKDPNQSLFASLGSMYLQQTPRIAPVGRIVFLRTSGASSKAEQTLLAGQHLTLAAPIVRHVQRGGVTFDLTIGDIKQKALP